MLNMKNYGELPDSMEPEEVATCFNEILIEKNASKSDIIEALGEMSDRQWHTYEVINPDLKEKITKWLIDHLDLENAEFVESTIYISAHLGLEKIGRLLKESLKKNLKPEVRKEIEEAIVEIKTWDDPYSGMK